jgi:hypothetical protein
MIKPFNPQPRTLPLAAAATLEPIAERSEA